jgi:hypothetical protein
MVQKKLFNAAIMFALSLGLTACCFFQENKVKSVTDGENLILSNSTIEIKYNKQKACFTVTDIKSNVNYVTCAKFTDETPEVVGIIETENDKMGMGKALRIKNKSGNIDIISLFGDSKFAYIRKVMTNNTKEAKKVKSINLLSINFAIPETADKKIKISGTYGLRDLTTYNIGSYHVFAAANAKNNGLVASFLTSNRGSGVIFSSIKDNKPTIDVRLDYGALQIKPDEKAKSEVFALGYFDDARKGLEKYAENVAKVYDIKLKPQPTVYCSWYHLYTSVNENNFKHNIDSAVKLLKDYGLNVVQIDDGWQAGEQVPNTPKKGFSHAAKSFSSGMEKTANYAEKAGFTAGLWYMPFSGDSKTKLYKDKQYLFAKDKDGNPYNVQWGGDAFDLSNPKTLKYVKDLSNKICNEWNYKYIKIDGLWSGTAIRQKYVNRAFSEDFIGESKLFDPSVTHIQAYRQGLRAVRAGGGDDLFILGCNLAQNLRMFGASIGLVDGMRIGADNSPKYPAIVTGPRAGGRLYFLHDVVWHNDPDPLYVRKELPLNQARLISSWVTVTGQMNSSSETFSALSPERLQLLRMSMPGHGLKSTPIDYFQNNTPAVWSVKDDRFDSKKFLIGYFNWTKSDGDFPKWVEDKPLNKKFSYTLDELGMDDAKTYVGYELWTNTFLPKVTNKLEMNVPDVTSRVISLREYKGYPVVVSTSRHITQGIIDMVDEKWEANDKALEGVSKVIANDPYEVRVIAKLDNKPVKATSVSVSSSDKKAGVKISIVSQDACKLIVKIESPETRKVEWMINF